MNYISILIFLSIYFKNKIPIKFTKMDTLLYKKHSHFHRILADAFMPICFLIIPMMYFYCIVRSFTKPLYGIPVITWNLFWLLRQNKPFDYIRRGLFVTAKKCSNLIKIVYMYDNTYDPINDNINDPINDNIHDPINDKIMYVHFPHGLYPYSMPVFAMLYNHPPLASRMLFNLSDNGFAPKYLSKMGCIVSIKNAFNLFSS